MICDTAIHSTNWNRAGTTAPGRWDQNRMAGKNNWNSFC